jgi:multicomponent Na+:H+ antiporter subunit A
MRRGRQSAILDAGIIVASGPILVFSLYLLAAGHNQPGGGFAGGLVAGVAIVLAWAGGGTELVRRIVPLRSSALMGAGLLVSTVTGLTPLVLDMSFLESGYVEFAIPLIGDVKLVSALLFDIGVYLLVVGMSLALVRALGESGPAETEPAETGAQS